MNDREELHQLWEDYKNWVKRDKEAGAKCHYKGYPDCCEEHQALQPEWDELKKRARRLVGSMEGCEMLSDKWWHIQGFSMSCSEHNSYGH